MIRPLPPLAMILLLWAAGLGAAGQFAKVSVSFPALQLAYPEAGASLGFALSLLSFVGLILGLVAGMIVARLGYRKLLLAGLILGALMSALQATLPSFPVLLASRLVEGLSHLVIVVAAPTFIAELAPDRLRPFAMTLWSTFFGVAYALAAWGGLPLIDTFGPGALFALHAGYMALMAGVLWLTLPRLELATGKTRLSPGDLLRRHGEIYRNPAISAVALGWLCYTLTFVALLTVLPLVLGPDAPGWLLGVLPLTSIAVSLTLVVALLRVMPAVRIVMAGFTLSALAVALVWALPGAIWPVVGLFGTLALVQAASFAAIPQLNATAQDRALANGAVAQMGNLGNLIGTPILLTMLAAFGPSGGLAVVLICYLLGLALHLMTAAARTR
ncbi:MFS transporter [Puniceibacterium sediminis]|uniref:Predicted arabinose efflux permease, MFS family n=1 Tax=Puniceibacterium sediminis TaxID=1608407 RepID=A0A238V3G6_9RHOB|nr:MFS transporter [Puniceibacterium sediminis]SNR28103.1 Predicted arabinose efflux permease, MFS family [Puniceibacterium sediminis]